MAIVMIIGTILGLVMLINGCRLLEADKFIKKMVLVMQKIIGSRIILLSFRSGVFLGYSFSKKASLPMDLYDDWEYFRADLWSVERPGF